jgi:hypothetical protein
MSAESGSCVMEMDISMFHGVYLLRHYSMKIYSVFTVCQTLGEVMGYSSEQDRQGQGT